MSVDDFKKALKVAAKHANEISSDDNIDYSRFAEDFEFFIENFSEESKKRNSILEDLRSSFRTDRIIRVAMTFITVLISITLLCLFFYIILCAPYVVSGFNNTLGKAVVTVAPLVGSIVLISILVRGIFQSKSDSIKNDLLPKNVHPMMDIIRHYTQG